MTKIEDFKSFVRNNPILINYVKENKMSWQNFYELYDLYGADTNIWNTYLKENKSIKEEKNNSKTINNIIEMARNIDTNKLEEGITSVQKALDLFGGMFIKKEEDISTYKPRPIYRKFDD